MLLIVLYIRKGIINFYEMIVCSVRLKYFSDHYKLLMTIILYLRQSYTTLDGYILLTAAIYNFRRLYANFGDYIYYFRWLRTIFGFA